MNYLAILVAAVVNMAIGAFWYSPAGFGKLWMKYSGMQMPKKMSKEEKQKMMRGYALGFVASLVMAWVMAHFIDFVGAFNPAEGAETAFWLWLGFVATVMFGDVIWMGKKLPHFGIDVGFRLVGMIAMGVIIAAW